METQATVSARLRWSVAGLTGLLFLYGLLISALASRVAAVVPANACGWLTALGRM